MAGKDTLYSRTRRATWRCWSPTSWRTGALVVCHWLEPCQNGPALVDSSNEHAPRARFHQDRASTCRPRRL